MKVVAIRDLLTKLSKRSECMDELALRLGHLAEVCGFEFLDFHLLELRHLFRVLRVFRGLAF
jgi:hypothetical protein